MKIATTFLLACLAFTGMSQKKIDSLLLKLSTLPEDTNKVNLYSRVAREFLYLDAKKAPVYADSGITLGKKIKYPRGVIRCLVAKGIFHRNSGEFEQGFESLFEAIRLAEGLKEPKLIAISYNNLGVLYKNQGRYSESVKALKIAQRNYQQAGDKNGVATTFQNMSNAYRRDKQYDMAIQTSQEAYKIYEAQGDHDGLISALSSMAAVYSDDKKDNAKALQYYLKAEQFLKSSDLNNKALVFQNLGSAYLGLKDYKKAENYIFKSLEAGKSLSNREQLRDNYGALSEICEATGDHKLALQYHKLFHAFADTIARNRYKKASLEMEEKFQSEKSKKEIELLSTLNDLKTRENEEQKNKLKLNRIIMLGALMVGILIAALAFLFYKNYKKAQKLNTLLTSKNHQIEYQKKEILDSILYARRIQDSILPHPEEMSKALPKHFAIYKPRDIVSGDFYWTYQVKGSNRPLTILALCDCTGHGVPGAFMSLISYTILNHIVKDPKTDSPDMVLNYLSKELPLALKNKGARGDLRDGLDIAVATIDFNASTIACSMANIPIYICDGESLRFVQCDKQSISADNDHPDFKFSLNHLQLKKGDRVYFCTDGFADQFGGPKGKKLKYKELEKLLFETHVLPLNEQQAKIESFFSGWKGALEQVDDVTLIGVEM